MRIGVLSDTHLISPNVRLEYILEELLGSDDMLLHAGDIVSGRVLDRLEEKGVLSVCGNMDDSEVAGVLPLQRIIRVAGIRIALIHGWGGKRGLEERLVMRLKPETPDIIIYGHTHIPYWGELHGTMMFNPGAAHTPYGDGGTVGRLEIVDGNVEASFLPIDGKNNE
jgi:putative phosphoesterase